jgi:hypothetical protein
MALRQRQAPRHRVGHLVLGIAYADENAVEIEVPNFFLDLFRALVCRHQNSQKIHKSNVHIK